MPARGTEAISPPSRVRKRIVPPGAMPSAYPRTVTTTRVPFASTTGGPAAESAIIGSMPSSVASPDEAGVRNLAADFGVPFAPLSSMS